MKMPKKTSLSLSEQSLKRKEYNRSYHVTHKEQHRIRNKSWYENNKPLHAAGGKRRDHNLKQNDPARYLVEKLNNRRKQCPYEISITKEDLIVPEFCPVLGLKLEFNSKVRDNSYSLDRFNNNVGYTPGNVRVISNRANSLKKDASVEELEAVIRYMKNKEDDGKPD